MSEIAENIVNLRSELQSLEGSLHKTRLTQASELEAFDAAKAAKVAEAAEAERRLAALQAECRAAESARNAASDAKVALDAARASLEAALSAKRSELDAVAAKVADSERNLEVHRRAAVKAEERAGEARAAQAEAERIASEQRDALSRMSLAHGERVRADRESLAADRAEFEASLAPRLAALEAKEKLVAKRTAWINETNAKLQLRKEECEMYYKRPFPDITFEPFNE